MDGKGGRTLQCSGDGPAQVGRWAAHQQPVPGLLSRRMPEFVHLHVHSQYSFLTSAVKLSGLAAKVKALGMPAVALTDHANMYGAIRHYNACRAAGIQPILGCEVNVARTAGSAVDHL